MRTVCPHDCPDTCSILAGVEDGRVVRADGDPAHPFTQGFLCHKVAAYPERIYSPKRVLHPMVRRRKGGAFERASWDEALDVVASRLGRGESILPYSYGGTLGIVQRNAGHPVFHKLGAAELDRTICDDAAMAGWNSMVGRCVGTDPSRAAESGYILIWGMNAAVVNLHWMPFVREAQRRGAKVVVVDPWRTETARTAQEHVAPRPGTDGALALGMARALLDEGLVDTGFVESRSDGFDAFRERLREWPVERASEVSGVRDVRRLARELAEAPSPFVRLGIGWTRHANGGQAMRCVTAMTAMAGAFRRGGVFFESGEAFEFDLDVIRRPDFRQGAARHVNMVRLGDELTRDDRVRSVVVYQCNPAAVAPDQSAVRRGLSREDLFLVVHEQMWTDTARLADVVLPACTSFETADLYKSYGHLYLQVARPVIAPVGEARSNVDLFNALAARLGFDDPFFEMDAEERIRLVVNARRGSCRDLDVGALMRGEPVRVGVPEQPFSERFATPSGRFRFRDDSMPDPLPGYEPCPEGVDSPERATYPLQLLAVPAKHFLNTTFGAVPSLVARQGRPTVLLNAAEAASRGLADGDLARVFNARGGTRASVVATPDVPPGIAVMPSVWWAEDVPGGWGVNVLTSQRLTDLGASSTLHCARVEVAADGGDQRRRILVPPQA